MKYLRLKLAMLGAIAGIGLGVFHQSPEIAQAEGHVSQIPLSHFKKDTSEQPCYDREKESNLPVTDLHIHPQPFGGTSISYPELMSYFEAAGVRFAMLYGIGQTLPYDGDCTYYLDCIGTLARPSLKNDFENAANYVEYPQENIHIGLSMTFPDLANPKSIADHIQLLDDEYPGLFKWMGEVNLHKEALRGNGHEPATLGDIKRWKKFMKVLREREIPIAIHSDLGDDANPTKNLALMEAVLKRYPNNKIIWMHMGLSRELVTMNAREHIKLMSQFLDANPNLSLDISWTVIAEAYFDTPSKKAQYVEFFNRYPTRILAGTDFVAASNKNKEIYLQETIVTGSIMADVNDTAFRAIALGQNYFDLAPGLKSQFEAPQICQSS